MQNQTAHPQSRSLYYAGVNNINKGYKHVNPNAQLWRLMRVRSKSRINMKYSRQCLPMSFGRAYLAVFPLPHYNSPELNPIKGLWDQVQDVTCNRRHESLDALEETPTGTLRPFWETPARLLSVIHHWLHAQANATH
jgi:hypothetical protein